MLTKIYQLLYTFSVEYLNGLACGAFCRIGDANVSNLIILIRLPSNVTMWNICV